MTRLVGLMTLAACGGTPKEDTGTGVSTTPPAVIMVSETSSGRILIADTQTGNFTGEMCLSEIFPDACGRGASDLARPCLMFGFNHVQSDGTDKILFTATLRDPDRPFAPSAVALVNTSHPPAIDWAIRSIAIPSEFQQGFNCGTDPEAPQCHLYGAHTATLQEDGTILVSDTSNSRLVWLRPPEDGSEIGTVSAVLSSQHPDWGRERYPNMVQSVSIEGEPHLLVTLKGSAGTGTTPTNEGQIVLWNVSDRTAPYRVWTFPEDGHLSAVHSGGVFDTPGGTLLIYAHSLGASSSDDDVREGTIGFAAFNGTEPPTYLADGRLPEPGFGFTREVEWVAEINRLMITDSGCENAQDDCSRQGRVVMTELPDLTPSERGGSARPDGTDQDYIELTWTRSAVDAALELPFDADRVNLDDAGPALKDGIGSCETP